MPTPNLDFENQVENTLQPGVAFNQLANDVDMALAGAVVVEFDADDDYELDRSEWMTAVLVLTDPGPVLTGSVSVIFPQAFPSMLAVNDTAQALTFEIDGLANTVTIQPGQSARISHGPEGVIADPVGGGGGSAQVVTLAGTSYTLDDLTPGAWHVFTSGSAVTITVEDDSVEPVPANSEYGLEARGSGGVTLVEDNDAEIIPPKGGTLELEEADFAVLKRTEADEYKLVGSTVAA